MAATVAPTLAVALHDRGGWELAVTVTILAADAVTFISDRKKPSWL